MRIYEVKLYQKRTVFDNNLKLVYRWYLLETKRYTILKLAIQFFRYFNRTTLTHLKAVLRVKQKGGK